MSDHFELTGLPDTRGVSWKQVVLGGFMAVAMALGRIANEIALINSHHPDRPA
jgi:hypothetical protein